MAVQEIAAIPSAATKVYWVDINRFDVKVDKSTYLEMARALTEQGFDVELLTGYKHHKYAPEDFPGRLRYFDALSTAGMFRVTLLLRILRWLVRHAGERDIVILGPNGLAMVPILRLLRRLRVNLDIRTLPVEIHRLRDRLDWLLFWYLPLRVFWRLPTSYSFITERLKQSTEREFSIRFTDYVIWTSGVNLGMFERPRVDPGSRSVGDSFTLFYHGAITRNRGLQEVVEGLLLLDEAHRRRVRLVVVGAGSDLARLREFTAQHGLTGQVTFKGLVPYPTVPAEIDRADCCICPLQDREEWNVSSPLKVLEYLAAAKPMILTPIPAHTDVVDGQGFVVWTRGHRPWDFAEAIERAMDDHRVLDQAAASDARRICEPYDWEHLGRRFAVHLQGKTAG